MLRRVWLALALACLVHHTPLAAQHHDADSAMIVATDIAHFWDAYDRLPRARTERDTVRTLFDGYYLNASPGLVDFINSRIGSVYTLAAVMSRHPGFYRSIRPATQAAAHAAPGVRRAFSRWKSLYPDAVFPDVYFVIGRMNSGGTTSPDKILIGAEMYGRTAETPDSELDAWHRAVIRGPDSIVPVVAHELIHVNQSPAPRNGNLLSAAIREGSADFLGELISGANTNRRLAAWAEPRERELWDEFRAAMHGTDLSQWLYQGSSAMTDRPADLGYWIGYRITQAYYQRAADKTKAIGDILHIADSDAFLAASGYADRIHAP